jgi:hypothetical protein
VKFSGLVYVQDREKGIHKKQHQDCNGAGCENVRLLEMNQVSVLLLAFL